MKAMSVTPVAYPHRSTREADHFEVTQMHAHRSWHSYGSDVRRLRETPAPAASFGTSLADILAASVIRPNR